MNLRVLVTSVINSLAYIFYSYYLNQIPIITNVVLIFSLTFIAYNHIIYLKLKKFKKENYNFFVINILLLIAAIICFFYLNTFQMICLCLSGLITYLYDNFLKLREKYFLKPIAIALSWCLLLIPLLEIQLLSILSLSIFLQILSLSLIYDEKDYDQDKFYQLKTLRSELGRLEMIMISSFIYMCSIVLFHPHTLYILSEVVIYAATIFIVRKSKSPWTFIVILDALIFIRPLVALFNLNT